MFVNYAHRGASHYAPENTLSAFYLGLRQQANGIETDIQRTRDGQLVLFHDATMDRVTDATGKIADYTLQELSDVLVYGDKAKMFLPDRLVTLEEFLHHFAHLNLTFAIEFKQRDLATDVLEMVNRYDALDKCIFTSFHFEDIEAVKALNKKAKIGFLTDDVSEEAKKSILDINGEQICMKASEITRERVEDYHDSRLSVRAWGVSTPDMIKPLLEHGVDGGMTVNFPDKLTELLKAM